MIIHHISPSILIQGGLIKIDGSGIPSWDIKNDQLQLNHKPFVIDLVTNKKIIAHSLKDHHTGILRLSEKDIILKQLPILHIKPLLKDLRQGCKAVISPQGFLYLANQHEDLKQSMIYQINPEREQHLFSNEINKPSAMCAFGNYLYAASKEGKIHIINQLGVLKVLANLKTSISSLCYIKDRGLFCGTNSGKIFAISYEKPKLIDELSYCFNGILLSKDVRGNLYACYSEFNTENQIYLLKDNGEKELIYTSLETIQDYTFLPNGDMIICKDSREESTIHIVKMKGRKRGKEKLILSGQEIIGFDMDHRFTLWISTEDKVYMLPKGCF